MSYMVIVAIMILLYIGLMHLSNALPNTIRHSWEKGLSGLCRWNEIVIYE